jgi:transcription antitermination protein NusB
MPILYQNEDGSGYTLRDPDDDRAYDLRPEGAQILLNVYGIRVGGDVDQETVDKLIGLRLATARPVEVAQPEPDAHRPSDIAPEPASAPTEPRPLAKHQRRTRGREVALQVLYQVEQNPGLAQAEIDRFLQRRLQEPKLCDFALGLVDGVKANRDAIDRMAAIDRNILRLGAFEMLFDEGVPAKVAINEALELAKRYSTAQSSRFVNGILDRLLTTDAARKAAESEPTTEPTPEPPPAEA